MNKLIALISVALFLSSCMGEREYQLRAKDIKAKMAHRQTAEITLDGPINIPAGGKMVIPFALPAYQQTDIPNGQAIAANAVVDGVKTAAIAGTVMYGIHNASGDTTSTTNVVQGE